jgi:hypothetical protein
MKRLSMGILAFSLLIVSALPAQDLTGRLEGRILDPEGESLAAALISVTGACLQGEQQTKSDERGRFLFLSLPNGTYSVRIHHEAYLDFVLEGVAVRLGGTTSLGRLQLKPKVQDAREVVVTAEPPLIDPTSTVVGASLVAEAIKDLPVGRNYRNIMAILPGVNQSYFGDEINVSGATGSENAYFIDGIDVSDPYMRYRNSSLPYNFVKEIEVKTGGYQAEYRSSLGGLVNAVTYSGGNDFRGQVFGFYTGSRFMQEAPRFELEPGSGNYAQYDVGFSLSGPIVRDRLWFFGAYNPATEREEVLIPGIDYYPDRLTRHIFAGKITYQPSSRANFVLTVHGDPAKHSAVGGVGPAVAGALNPDPLLSNIAEGGYNFLGSGSYMFGDKIVLETSLAYITRRYDSGPATELGAEELFYIDEAAGRIASGGHIGQNNRKSYQFTAAGKGTFSLGKHILKAGFEYRDNRLDSYFDQQTLFGQGEFGYILQVLVGQGTVRNRVPSLFIQDSWRASDRLQINAGLRWSGEFLVASNGKTSQSITDEYQPRLGFIFQPEKIGTSKIFGSYGRFFQELSTLLMTWYQMEDFRWQWILYDHDPRSDPSGGVIGSEWLGGIMPEIAGLKGQNYDEFALGYERVLGANYKIGILGTYRDLRDGIEDAIEGFGNPGRPPLEDYPRMTRKYLGLELTFMKSGGKRFNFGSSYTLSRSYGNYPGLFAQDLADPRPNVSGQFDSPEQMIHATGFLPNHRPHVFKFFGSYRLEMGLSAGVFFLWESGTPLSEIGTQTMIPGWIMYLTQRGTAGRTSSVADLNIRVTYDMKKVFHTRIAPRVILDVFHMGSNRTPVTYDERHYFGVDNEGNQTDPNPLYLHPTGYFPPMSARLGLEMNF